MCAPGGRACRRAPTCLAATESRAALPSRSLKPNPRRGALTGTPAKPTSSEPARHPRDVCANRACLSARPYLPRGLCAMRLTDFDFTSTTIEIPIVVLGFSIVVLVLYGNYTCYFRDGTHVGARRQARPRNRFRPNQPGTRATYAPTGRACRRAPTCLAASTSSWLRRRAMQTHSGLRLAAYCQYLQSSSRNTEV